MRFNLRQHLYPDKQWPNQSNNHHQSLQIWLILSHKLFVCNIHHLESRLQRQMTIPR